MARHVSLKNISFLPSFVSRRYLASTFHYFVELSFSRGEGKVWGGRFSRGVRREVTIAKDIRPRESIYIYKLNPAATAIEIWNRIVFIYHSSLLRRASRRAVSDLVEDTHIYMYKWMITRIVGGGGGGEEKYVPLFREKKKGGNIRYFDTGGRKRALSIDRILIICNFTGGGYIIIIRAKVRVA